MRVPLVYIEKPYAYAELESSFRSVRGDCGPPVDA